ncbi:hypothetical protein W97_05843 [Coniosporium apollinis CBS 100218]|uniref:peptidyl-tRNA hydrolase n=1 Tax=Coniosporium apollinis (strain CBS 100218) TaxID=1168221 RepID=R7YXJ4_CONA1|nr:uncharacterized protein W97_05843 [Coniosporium apollinis CBS 100218]EON66597.1 hypothetical protein W97_05843 [Coniosporium apollinis CBS 100218]
MPPGPPIPLFIASLGNPGPLYSRTLHSAGHVLLQELRVVLSFPAFEASKPLGKGLVSQNLANPDNPWCLWQSPSLMNTSGVALAAAWRHWQLQREREGRAGVLVVLHDELEKGVGEVKVRTGGSARGHNGLKSIQAKMPQTPFVRVGIGIGRPESREPSDVARYVLRKMTDREEAAIGDVVGVVIGTLREVQEGRIRPDAVGKRGG